MYQCFGKRLLDLVISFCLLALLSPLLLLVTLILKLVNKGPVIFLQTRPGLNERSFKIIKFKTMTDARGPDGLLLPDRERVTKVGRIVRALSIDELLQLLNVLRGDMSIVGPRPLLPEYLPYYSVREHHRHDVKPGITGLAQVKGRNSLSWERRLRYDTFYVDHFSFCLDLKILIQTAIKVLRSTDVDPGLEASIGRLDEMRDLSRQNTMI